MHECMCMYECICLRIACNAQVCIYGLMRAYMSMTSIYIYIYMYAKLIYIHLCVRVRSTHVQMTLPLMPEHPLSLEHACAAGVAIAHLLRPRPRRHGSVPAPVSPPLCVSGRR